MVAWKMFDGAALLQQARQNQSLSCVEGQHRVCAEKNKVLSQGFFLFLFYSSWFERNTVFALPDPPILVRKQCSLGSQTPDMRSSRGG